MPRPRRKLGRTYNLYLSDEVNDLIEKYRGNLSRSQFVEEAVMYYVSQLAENTQENKDQQKNYNKKEDSPNKAEVAELGQRRQIQGLVS